jgi:hypothetical protein
MTRRRSISRRDQAERRFPWRVDVLVPELGLQQRLTAMLEWVERRLAGATSTVLANAVSGCGYTCS